MVTKRCKMLPTMLAIFLVSLISMLSFSNANTEGLVRIPMSNDVTLSEESNLETYIVYVKKPKGRVIMQSTDLDSWYKSFLPVTISSSNQQPRIVYSYKNVATGFAAKLTAEEAKAMKEKDEIVLARPERKLPLHTTHSPSFLGLQEKLGFWNHSHFGKGVIIGLLDTGVTPDHPSFHDEKMPPPPAKWKGKCEFNRTACNNKLIGARNFVNKGEPPLDTEGHGTHTASTAAGNFVKNASVFGNANGTAVGIAPLAHVAMYKVCEAFCSESAILAAMDTAIDDGVDILSLSIGGGSVPFYDDLIAVGAFAAIQKGILVSCSAGNSGPVYKTLANEAPWILTVGASTIDRTIMAIAKLGNGEEFVGESVDQPKDFPSTLLPLVYAGANGSELSAFCAEGSLKNVDVKGKVVLCERGGGVNRIDKGQAVKDAGGAAMILMNDELNGYSTLADAHVLPATHVSYAAGESIMAYINSISTPTATILFKGTVIGNPLAPEVTSFSSRGPSLASPGILKPDIVGPGVSILAAWPVSVENNTNTKSTFNIISGTSMSCPHLAGVAALLKSAHPDWSPAAIKSAIMTSADIVNLGGKPIVDQTHLPADIFAIGAGHVNPSRSNDPGLLYDIQPDDYIPYLCGLNYTDKQVEIIVQRKVSCSKVKSIPEAQLNYPSFCIILGASPQTYTRAITNIANNGTLYSKVISAPKGVDVHVSPDKIYFGGVNLTGTYTVTFSRNGNINELFSQGHISWVSETYFIRIPIAVGFE